MSRGASGGKTKFICQQCGYESPGWLGKCPGCGEWNTLVEELIPDAHIVRLRQVDSVVRPLKIGDISVSPEIRYSTGIGEMDRVLGGGIVKGSLILVGGDPGIGKSTLLLQVCGLLSPDIRVLYVSGEESAKQIKMRAERLGVRNAAVSVFTETCFEVIGQLLRDEKPDFVVIDSVQTIFSSALASSPGSVGQIRDVTTGLMRIAKDVGISVVVVGHVTKEGAIAGPKVLEHIVDTVLYFEGEKNVNYRILRAVKNRFGSTNEIGIFEMCDGGLKEVTNPSAALLSGRSPDVPGSAVIAGMEGTRPVLLEVQALVCPTGFGTPRRMTVGLDYNRVAILLAVLEKTAGMMLHDFDTYVSVAGGLRMEEPACDLGIIAAVASSFRNAVLDPETVFIGEVGLTGEIRAVNQVDRRISEAARLGFRTCIVPGACADKAGQVKNCFDIDIRPASHIKDMLDAVL